MGIVEAVAGAGKGEDGGQADSAQCTVNMNQTSTDWVLDFFNGRIHMQQFDGEWSVGKVLSSSTNIAVHGVEKE